ncbi:MAG: hypothetical protein RLZZ484_1831 [Pseudomonadota bacterium]|jgi:UDP-glucose:(heptosyl)LPS alpha-1,3-glucosyltransferase
MRVAVLNRSFCKTGGGAESYSVAIVQALAQRHDIHVFSQETDQPVAGVTYHRVPCISPKPRWLNQWLFALVTWWKTRSGFDVVHSHENTWHGQIQTIHVRTVSHSLFNGKRGLDKAVRWLKVLLSLRLQTYLLLERLRFKNSPRRYIVAASDLLRLESQAIFSACTHAQWSSIAPGTDIPKAAQSAEDGRQQLGLPLNVPLILFVANDCARKGLDALLSALSVLDDSVHLAIAGHTGQKARYQRIASQLGLSQRIHFLGSLPDLSPAYASADVLAHPTLEDSYGMVVLEAMAHRLPVVVSNATYCGISRELMHSHNALLLQDPRDAQALAQALQSHLFSDADRLHRFKEQAFEFAAQHTWQAAALRYEALYQKAAACETT